MYGIKERPEFEAYQKVKLLGEGSFGKAFLVRRVNDGNMCVMKMIDIGRMSEKEKKETLQEARLLEAFSHPNIVTFIEVFKTKRGKLCIIMDYCDGKSSQISLMAVCYVMLDCFLIVNFWFIRWWSLEKSQGLTRSAIFRSPNPGLVYINLPRHETYPWSKSYPSWFEGSKYLLDEERIRDDWRSGNCKGAFSDTVESSNMCRYTVLSVSRDRVVTTLHFQYRCMVHGCHAIRDGRTQTTFWRSQLAYAFHENCQRQFYPHFDKFLFRIAQTYLWLSISCAFA